MLSYLVEAQEEQHHTEGEQVLDDNEDFSIDRLDVP